MAKKNKNKQIAGNTVLPPQSLSGEGATVMIDPNQSLADAAAKGALSPEQVQQMQMEDALKEGQDPSLRLRKLKSPLSVKSCLFTILLFIILTVAITFVVIYFTVDTFNIGVVFLDMLDKLGVTAFFQGIGNWFIGLFNKGSLLF